jgi:hypothetical protein
LRPDNYIGAPIAMQFVLARSTEVVLVVRHVLAYLQGMEFELELLVTSEPDDPDELMGFEGLPYYMKKAPNPNALPDGLFRFGVQFSDGSKATTLRFYQPMHVERPDQPVLQREGSQNLGTGRIHHYWLWPLPTPGTLAFVCEWPAFGIGFTRHEVDASPIRLAGSKASAIWSAPG